jgi:hypothetical protein
MQNNCDYPAGACYSPAGSDKICFVNFSLHQSAFACACLSHRLCCGSHSSITIGHNSLDEFVFLIQGHVADIMTTVTVFADVTGLATAVAGLH